MAIPGKVPETPCEVCGGEGVTAETKTYEVDVPAGIENGQRIRISGAGHAGGGGASAGDLYAGSWPLRPQFRRQPRHLVSTTRRVVPTLRPGVGPRPSISGRSAEVGSLAAGMLAGGWRSDS